LKEFQEILSASKKKGDNFIENICGLMANYNVSYEDLFGAEYEVFHPSGSFKIVKEGMPIEAINDLIEFIHKQAKEQEKKMKGNRRFNR